MGTPIKILLICLSFASSCKFISQSFRGKHDSKAESSAGTDDASAVSGGTEQPDIPGLGPGPLATSKPTVPEDTVVIPEPPLDLPLEGVITKRSGGGIDISGNVAGIWDKTLQPIHVTGDITLKTGKTLYIKEGVQVLFDANVRFFVEGALLKIIGTKAEPVSFTSSLPDQTWGGIRVCAAESCDVENVKGRVEVRFALFEKARKADLNPNDVTWRHGGVFYLRSTESLIIEDSTFQNNFGLEKGGAVEIIAENANIIFRRNTLKDNSNEGGGGALQITNGRNLLVEKNVFVNNSSKAEGGALALVDSAGIFLIGNSFENNRSDLAGGGIFCDGHGSSIQIDGTNIFKTNTPTDSLCKDE